MVDRNRRGIIILFTEKDGYKLASKNYNCFSSENEDGGNYFSPELWVEERKGNLLFALLSWSVWLLGVLFSLSRLRFYAYRL